MEAVDGEEPGGKAAEVPFGADVRAGADDGVETEVPGGAQEAAEVARSGEVGLAGGGLVEVPGDVRVHGVDTQGAQPPQPVLPQAGMDPEVVQGARDDAVGAACAPESVLVVREHALTPERGRDAVRCRTPPNI